MPSNKKNITTRSGRSNNSSSSTPSKGQSWFFGIGINKYQNGFKNLNNARKDVEDILAQLKTRYELDQIKTLFDHNATRKKIWSNFRKIENEVKKNDKLIVYFAGHGILDDKKDGYWIPSDAENGQFDSYIPNIIIKNFIRRLDAKHILLISDSCFSGSLIVRSEYDPNIAFENMERYSSRWILTSGRESVPDGHPGKNSPFANSILKVLRENEDSHLNIGLLSDKVTKHTGYNSRQSIQNGPLFEAGHDGGQYVFKLQSDIPKGQYNEPSIPTPKSEVRAISKTPLQRFYQEYKGLFAILILGLAGITVQQITSPKSSEAPPSSKPENTITLGGQTYRTIKLKDGNIWMAENMNFEEPNGSFCYNCNDYGRLYTYEAAKNVCKRLTGWRLPTNEEWEKLKELYGPALETAFQALIEGGSSGFGAKLGGTRDSEGNFYFAGQRGFYWSDKVGGQGLVFGFFRSNLSSNTRSKMTSAQSVRCIKN